jgi:mannonate dehydratase
VTAAGAPRIALGQFAHPSDPMLRFAAQLGVEGVLLNTPAIPGERRWELADLVGLRERCEAHGLRLEAIENVPNAFYERAMLGIDGRDEDIENLSATIRNLGAAGVPVLGLNFCPGSVWRTWVGAEGRGGASVNGFDAAAAESGESVYIARRDQRRDDPWVKDARFLDGVEIDEDGMWRNLEYFLRAIAPVAEEADVRIALHPDDPPVATLAGVARILRDVDRLERALQIASSPAVGLDLCFGTVSASGGEAAVLDAVERFGPRGQIVYVHFRDVRGTVPVFEECFLGEGNYRPERVMNALIASGFDGFIIDDHVPQLVDDTAFAHRGRAHATGYIQGLLASGLAARDGMGA